jgi:hypothetical protein
VLHHNRWLLTGESYVRSQGNKLCYFKKKNWKRAFFEYFGFPLAMNISPVLHGRIYYPRHGKLIIRDRSSSQTEPQTKKINEKLFIGN